MITYSKEMLRELRDVAPALLERLELRPVGVDERERRFMAKMLLRGAEDDQHHKASARSWLRANKDWLAAHYPLERVAWLAEFGDAMGWDGSIAHGYDYYAVANALIGPRPPTLPSDCVWIETLLTYRDDCQRAAERIERLLATSSSKAKVGAAPPLPVTDFSDWK